MDQLQTAWEPQPGFQTAFVECPVFEIFGGGSRGGGKSDAVLGDWALHAAKYGKDAIGLMVRRSRTELVELFERGREIYSKVGASITYNPMRVVFPNGARLQFSYLERDSDAESYQGFSLTRLYVEEAGNFPSPAPVMKLMATLRSGAGVPVGIRLTGNPGGPGQHWLKARYVDPEPLGWKIINDPNTGLQRIFLPSRVTDNKYLGSDYVQRLKASGSPELVRAWLYGDWSVVAGSFFPEFSMDRHVIAPRTLPEHWARFRSFDWGSARPFSVGWWAVSDGTLPDIARGALVRYREWYGMKPGEPNVGLRMTAEEIARGIALREEDEPRPIIGVADPAIFAEDGGPSIAQRMILQGVVLRPADNKRVAGRGAIGGWDQVRSRLIGDEDGRPMLLMFSTCRDLIRTLPAMQHDDARPEDIDTESEDHAVDECFVADTLVETETGPRPIADMRVGSLVHTRLGLRPVCAVFSNGVRPVYRLLLSNGATLDGTANHPVWVDGRGFIPLSSLRYGDMISPCIQISTIGLRGAFGGGFMARYLKAIISITSTAMNRTTIQRISNASLQRSIAASISTAISRLAFVASAVVATSAPVFASARTPVSPSGGGMLESMTNVAGVVAAGVGSPSIDTATRPTVHTNAQDQAHMSGRWRSIVATIAGLRSKARMRAPSGAVTVVGAPTIVGERRVYNLSVEQAEEYFANGVLVSNCRYGCMSRPFVRDAVKPKVEDTWDLAFQRANQGDGPAGWRVA